MANPLVSIAEKGPYYGLYMGSTYVIDPQKKEALKQAARAVLELEDQIVFQSFEVDLHLEEDQVKVTRTINKKTFLQFGYGAISACFILRENTKIVSIGVGQPNNATNAHVFMLTTSFLADQLIRNIIKHFDAPEMETNAKPALKEPTVGEPPKSVNVHTQMASACLLDW